MWPKYFMTFAKSKGGQEGARRIEGGADDLFVERHCLCEIYGKNNVWKRNFQYKNDWYTLQKSTKPVLALRDWENLDNSSINSSWSKDHSIQNYWVLFYI